jgi:hypothetical protein
MCVWPPAHNFRITQLTIRNGDKQRLVGNEPLNDELLAFGMLYYRL